MTATPYGMPEPRPATPQCSNALCPCSSHVKYFPNSKLVQAVTRDPTIRLWTPSVEMYKGHTNIVCLRISVCWTEGGVKVTIDKPGRTHWVSSDPVVRDKRVQQNLAAGFPGVEPKQQYNIFSSRENPCCEPGGLRCSKPNFTPDGHQPWV